MSKPFVLVLMPYAESFNDIYENGIKAACNSKEIDMYCERVDEQIYEERVLDRIYNQINKADYIIADLSGKNPNVFYETGYAHALGKDVILLINDATDTPFNLKHHRQIVYNDQEDSLFKELVRTLKWYKQNPKRKSIPNFNSLEFYIDGQSIKKDVQISLKRGITKSNEVYLDIDVNNQSDTMYADHVEIYLEINDGEFLKGNHGTKLPNNRSGVMYPCGTVSKILPNAWQKLSTTLVLAKNSSHKLFHLQLVIYTELNTIVIPFTINLNIEQLLLRPL
ncbi:MAG: hypothetical protein ACOVMQ_07020 [Cyclobacteriaceae bacterium]|jgi:hypothetical protein